MKHVRSVNWFRILTQVDRISSKKHTLKKLTKGIEKILSGNLKNTKVFVIIGHGGSAKTAESNMGRTIKTGSFVDDFAALVVSKKKNVTVNKNLAVFCRSHRIKPAHRNVRSVFGAPLQHQSKVYGAIILENVKDVNAFKKEAENTVGMIAQRLAAEIAYDRLAQENNRLEQDIKDACLTDPLTNMPNRRFCDLILDMEFRRAKGYTRQLSLALITPDNYRSISSKYGNAAGDSLLLHVAATLKKNVRDTDFVGRFKDDEFLVLLPEAVNEAAVNAAERVRDAFECAPFAVKRLGRKKVTLSIGVVTYPSSAETLIALLEHAGKALKRAKQVGRNQVVAL
ncbi:MAG: sensor domain-containing diguanylate cyclase [candidate division WOR-3 bacterium]|nr:sensor domain-containing diguanylate cyclase [candidate division WOR-3 bacterium]